MVYAPAGYGAESARSVEVTAYDAADAVDQARLEVGEGAKVLGVHPKPPRKVEGFQQITAWVAAGRSFLTGQLVSQRQFVVRESLLEGEALDFVFRDSRATEDVVVTVSRRVVEDLDGLRLNLGEIVLDEAKKFIAS